MVRDTDEMGSTEDRMQRELSGYMSLEGVIFPAYGVCIH